MSSESVRSLKLQNLNDEIFKSLNKRTVLLKKKHLFVSPPPKFLKETNFEESFLLTSKLLKKEYRINSKPIEARVFIKEYMDEYKNMCKCKLSVDSESEHFESINIEKNEQIEEINVNESCEKQNDSDNVNSSFEVIEKEREKYKSADFLDSMIQIKIPVLTDYEQTHLFMHIIELIDAVAADTVYRHCLGAYREDAKYRFVTLLFNNLKVYKTREASHEFSFSLNHQLPLIINSYIVYAGITSYILKIDFIQNGELIFDLYSTFVNINSLTLRPTPVLGVNNYTENIEYMNVRKFVEHLKNIQGLFNYKDIMGKHLQDEDINYVQQHFNNVSIQKIKNNVDNCSENEQLPQNIDNSTNSLKPNDSKEENTLNLLDLFDKKMFPFFIGKSNYLCKDSYVESNYFITSQYKNVHNFTFGGYLAHLSFCHAFAVAKQFLKKPILNGINEIQYILPMPYNATVVYKGKIVYTNKNEIYVKIFAYYYDKLKNVTYLTTIFDLSFQNNEGIAFIPQSPEEIKFYLLSHIRSILLQQ